MSALHDLQGEHVRCTGLLIAWAYANGYELTWGQTLRTAAEAAANAASAAGIVHSLHTIKLAVDFSLSRDGAELVGLEDYRPLGDYWKTLHPLARWGGDFKNAAGESDPDADHFSLTYGGIK